MNAGNNGDADVVIVGTVPAHAKATPKAGPSKSSAKKSIMHVEVMGKCAVCTLPFFQNNLSVTPCGHVFHSTCIGRWLQDHAGCATCRKPAKDHTFRIFLDNLDVDPAHEKAAAELEETLRLRKKVIDGEQELERVRETLKQSRADTAEERAKTKEEKKKTAKAQKELKDKEKEHKKELAEKDREIEELKKALGGPKPIVRAPAVSRKRARLDSTVDTENATVVKAVIKRYSASTVSSDAKKSPGRVAIAATTGPSQQKPSTSAASTAPTKLTGVARPTRNLRRSARLAGGSKEAS